MDRRTPPTGPRRNPYRSSPPPRRNVRPARPMPNARPGVSRPGGRSAAPPPANYRQYARHRRRGTLLKKVAALLVAAVLVGAVFVVLNAPGIQNLFQPEEEAQPAVAPVEQPEPTGFVVAVDPGHGGGDPGTEGISFTEEEMTWDTARRLMELLEADDRFAPVMTTDGTEYERPSQRAANAREQGAQLLISIHGNSGDDPEYAGFECYPVPPGRTYNAESLAFGRMIAERFGQTGERLRGEGGVRYLYYEDNNEKHVYEVSDTSVHTDTSFTLLEECGCPAVLAEQCFITSPADVDAFGDEDGRQAAAQIYYEAICEWYDTYGPQADTASPAPATDSLT
ncbi:N-acetylmuramoyl-L-alanine amidase [uncultured Gemmiger sp.]|uniref:N-acetylmuramoyl-L-alanine amidase family protein n=1 Tax=uncultured Gemmiger sp. TaxID=1623490 RepID=UPI0025E8C585|nr:N-acetylmuramoyl-L-alanine amidase [uncultured Gemmiger sp.]